MTVNSIDFWYFFVIVLLFYYGAFSKSAKWQNVTLLISSFIFYGFVDWGMCLVLLSATIVYYCLGLVIYHHRKEVNNTINTKLLLGFSVLPGILLLFYFKYYSFFIGEFSNLLSSLGLNTNWNSFKIIMPLGISFFTFKLIGYIIEVYRGNMMPCKDFISFGVFIAYFPTIMSGPIDNSKMFIPQLTLPRKVNGSILTEASRRILWGIFLKFCIADRLSVFTTMVLQDYSNHNATSIAIASILYSFQLYADFSGYSDMAIGVSQILGIKISENFSRPYFSASVSEFWKRWHISLTKWLTQYIYISLGGNRCSKIKQYWNVMVTFLVSGIWHGANWTFILWGILHGIYQVVEKILGLNNYLKNPERKRSVRPEGGKFFLGIRILFTFLLVSYNWLLFQSQSITDFYNTTIILISGFSIPDMTELRMLAVTLVLLFFMLSKEFKDEYIKNVHFLHSQNRFVYLFSFFSLSIIILMFGNFGANSFIYFQF